MSIPAYIPMLGLYNDLELGPNCPDEKITCNQCEQKGECHYAESDHG